MKKTIKTSLSLAFLLFSSFSHSAWYEVSSVSSFVTNADTARVNAIEDAIYQAVKFSNADLSSLKNIRPFLEVKKDNYQFIENEIRQVIIKDVKKVGKKIKVTVKVDIYPDVQACHNNLYRKKILLTEFNLINPRDASLGGIFQFGANFTEVLQNRLMKESQSFVVQGISPYKVSASDPHQARLIAQENNAQYILLGNIIDLSSTLDKKNKDKNNRQLAIEIDVIDGKSGNVSYQNRYRNIASWEFERSSKVNTKTARFWASSYGNMALNMTKDILLDLESKFSCQIPTLEVIGLNKAIGKINAGKAQGVNNGDILELWHNSSFIDKYGTTQKQLRKSQIKLTVTRVYADSADIDISPKSLASSIQLGDLAIKLLK